MKKIILTSVYGSHAKGFVTEKIPSRIVPFRGKFPLLPMEKVDEYLDILKNGPMYLEDCPIWFQTIVLIGYDMYNFHIHFLDYLTEHNYTEQQFVNISSKEKSKILLQFMDTFASSPEHLNISYDFYKTLLMQQ